MPMRVTSTATSATTITRRYCINATSRTSAPKLSAMIVIAAAAPGDEPQIAVEPGKTCSFAIIQPRMALAKITEKIQTTNSGQSAAIRPNTDGGMACAIIAPTTACAALNPCLLMVTGRPLMARKMPANIGPSSRAAGRWSHSITTTNNNESVISCNQLRHMGVNVVINGNPFVSPQYE